MANLAVQTLSAAGTNVTFAASAASDTAHVGNGRNTVLILHNGTGAPVTWTVLVPGNTFLGVATDDNAVTVPAGEYRYVLLVKDYADDTSRATITTASPAAGIEAAVVRLG